MNYNSLPQKNRILGCLQVIWSSMFDEADHKVLIDLSGDLLGWHEWLWAPLPLRPWSSLFLVYGSSLQTHSLYERGSSTSQRWWWRWWHCLWRSRTSALHWPSIQLAQRRRFAIPIVVITRTAVLVGTQVRRRAIVSKHSCQHHIGISETATTAAVRSVRIR